jgi:hypothetical protein
MGAVLTWVDLLARSDIQIFSRHKPDHSYRTTRAARYRGPFRPITKAHVTGTGAVSEVSNGHAAREPSGAREIASGKGV